MGFYIINDTQLSTPVAVVLVNFLAGIRKKRSPTIKATVESVTNPGYLKTKQMWIIKMILRNYMS
jgi:hypothetical protein